MKKLMGFFKAFGKAGGEELLDTGLGWADKLIPETMDRAQIIQLEDAVKKNRLIVSGREKDVEIDLGQTAERLKILERAKTGMGKIKEQMDAAKKAGDDEKYAQLREKALKGKAQLDEAKAEYERELKEDEDAKIKLAKAQKILAAYEGKLKEVEAIQADLKNRKENAEADLELAEIENENADALAGLERINDRFSRAEEEIRKIENKTRAEEMETESRESDKDEDVFADILDETDNKPMTDEELFADL